MMAYDDERFDMQVRAAFDSIELSDEASERMLANLLAARDAAQQGAAGVQISEAPAGAPATAPETPAGEVVPFTPRRGRWQRWLPLAAAVVAALVIVRVTGVLQTTSNSAADMAPRAEEKSAVDAGTLAAEPTGAAEVSQEEYALEESADAVAYDAAPMAEGAAAESAPTADSTNGSDAEAMGVVPTNAAELYPRIALSDGTVLTALVDGLYVQEVDAANVGQKVGEAQATAFDGGDAVACTVFELVDEPDAYAVRFEGEDSYWRCTMLA